MFNSLQSIETCFVFIGASTLRLRERSPSKANYAAIVFSTPVLHESFDMKMLHFC